MSSPLDYIPGIDIENQPIPIISWLFPLCSRRETRILWSNRSTVNDDDIRALPRLPRVVSVKVRATNITDKMVKAFAELRHLLLLDLGETVISDLQVSDLGEMPALQTLFLDSTRITDGSIPSIVKLRQLRNVCLENTAVTASGVRQLRTLPRLQWLRVSSSVCECESVLLDLREALPGVSIRVHD